MENQSQEQQDREAQQHQANNDAQRAGIDQGTPQQQDDAVRRAPAMQDRQKQAEMPADVIR